MAVRHWALYFRYAVGNISSNRLIHAISTGTITISLLLFGAFVLFFVNINDWVLEWGQTLTMSVYLEDDIGQEEKQSIEATLSRLPGAEISNFISKDRALSDLKDTLGPQGRFLEGLNENPLPASFEVVFKNLGWGSLNPKMIKEDLEKLQGVDEVQYSEQWLERFEGFVYLLRLVGLIIGGLLCIAVLFIITNTIRLTIYSRRDEIEIYKLVGATDWFVKTPFLIEGAIQGIVGALAALGILFLMYSLLSLKTVHIFGLPLMQVVFLPERHTLFILSLGLVLGLMGSFIAIGRFFRFFYD